MQTLPQRGQLVRFDAKTREFQTYFPGAQAGLRASALDFSRDGQWIAYMSFPDGSLWRSRPDGPDPQAGQAMGLSHWEARATAPRG